MTKEEMKAQIKKEYGLVGDNALNVDTEAEVMLHASVIVALHHSYTFESGLTTEKIRTRFIGIANRVIDLYRSLNAS